MEPRRAEEEKQVVNQEFKCNQGPSNFEHPFEQGWARGWLRRRQQIFLEEGFGFAIPTLRLLLLRDKDHVDGELDKGGVPPRLRSFNLN